MTAALELARWLIVHHEGPVTHLKLQKLAFYSYGAALAFGQHAEIGTVAFEAWEHGPVNRTIWQEYRTSGRAPLARPAEVRSYSASLSATLEDVLAVYGAMSAWALRNESHNEDPWEAAWKRGESGTVIDEAELRSHFHEKFRTGAVKIPGELLRSWSYAVDRIPVQGFTSLHELANKLRAA